MSINKIIGIIGLALLFSLLSPGKAMSTETLDCSCDKYLVSLHVGSTGYFGTVLLYEEGKSEYVLYKREKLKTAYLNWNKKTLRLEYAADSKDPDDLASFKVQVKGKTKGTLRINDKTYSIKCWW
jgi:hypothetical protein